MDIAKILIELERNKGYFPREAVKAAIANRDAITPELLGIIEHTTKHAVELEKDHAYMAHLYAFFLLAQFREQRAYPLIVDFFSLPGELTSSLTGDLITESLGQILASVCGGDTSKIKSLIENEEIDEYVRSAGLKALICLVVSGEMNDEEVTSYLKTLFNGGLERKFSHVWNSLVSNTARLCSNEMLGDIEKAFDDDLIEPFWVKIETIKEMLVEDRETKLQNLRKAARYNFIVDTVSEMQGWACFQPKKRSSSKSNVTSVKVGRNDPCPCGSGKKYKKCCCG